MATIRKRGKKWQVQVRRRGFGCLSRSFPKKADALRWARDIEGQADRNGLAPDAKTLRRLTVRDIIERYRDTVVTQKRGKEVETTVLNAFLRQRVAHKVLADVTATDFSAYRDQRLKSVQGATIRRELGLLQHAFEIARREWGIPLAENPLTKVKKPQPNRARERRLDHNEAERLLAAFNACRNKLIGPLIRLAIETGMRRGELLNLCWSDMDLEQRTLHIPHTKNGYPRTIPLSRNAVEIIEGLRGLDSERAFPTSANAVRLAWKRLTKRAGITDLHFHDLRHEAISRFFEKGLSVAEVALISGHRDFRQLFRYTHLRAEDLVRKLD